MMLRDLLSMLIGIVLGALVARLLYTIKLDRLREIESRYKRMCQRIAQAREQIRKETKG